MKVAIIKPPSANNNRGVGVYAESLISAISNLSGLDLKIIEFSRFSSGFNKFDIVHFPYFDFFFLTLPWWKRTKTVVTIHDMTPIILPSGFPKGIKGEIKWQIQRSLLSISDGIICVSESSKKDLQTLLGYPDDRTRVIYEAADSIYKRIDDRNLDRNVINDFKLPSKYILYVGDINYNKNLSKLFESFKTVLMQEPQTKLILVGSAFVNDKLVEAIKLRTLAKNLGIVDDIIYAGKVSKEDLVVMYNLASVYVQPSIYEGFGLPVVEAMSCGCPVICGQNSSLPEVAGNVAIYADVTDARDLSKKMLAILNLSKNERELIIKKGLDQAAKFSWEKTAKETYEFYQKISSR